MAKNQKMIKKNSTYIILLLMLATVALPISIGGANGSKVFISDIVITVTSIYYFSGVFRGQIRLNNKQRIFLLGMLIFIFYLLLAMGIHVVQKSFNKDQISLIRNFYMSFFILFFVSSNKISKLIVENTLLIFITLSNIFQLGYLFLNFELRSSPLFINIVLYSVIAQMLLGFLFLVWTSKKREVSKSKKRLAGMNLFAILFFIPFTGLRAGTALIVGMSVCYILFYTYIKGLKIFIRSLLGLTALGIVFSGVMSVAYITKNKNALDVVSRSLGVKLNTNTVKSSVVLAEEAKTNTTIKSQPKVDDGSQSDAFRSVLNKKAIEEIKANFVIGPGKLLVSVYDNATKRVLKFQPHNFLLELLLGYGLVGTILFFLLILAPYYIKKIRFKQSQYLLLSMSILAGLFVFSWVQPTINRILPLQIFFMIQLYLMKREDEELLIQSNITQKKRKVNDLSEQSNMPRKRSQRRRRF